MSVASPSVDVPLQYIPVYGRRENRVILLIVVWIRGALIQNVVIILIYCRDFMLFRRFTS